MQRNDSSSRSPADLRPKQFVTIRISKTAGLWIVIATAVSLAFVLGALYGRRGEKPAPRQLAVEQPQPANAQPAAVVPARSPERREPARQDVPLPPATEVTGVNDPPPAPYNDQAQEAVGPEPAFEDRVPAERARYVPVSEEQARPPEPASDEGGNSELPEALSSPNTNSRDSAAPRTTVLANLNGAGATFPYAIYQKWFSEFHHCIVKLQLTTNPLEAAEAFVSYWRETWTLAPVTAR